MKPSDKEDSWDSLWQGRGYLFSPKIILILVFIGSIVLRIWAAVSRLDNHWADEQFQVLEPASWVIFHHGFLSWEWHDGYRSWVVPGLYMPLFYVLKEIGIRGGVAVLCLSRLFTALIGCGVIFRIDKILTLLRVSFWPRAVALAFFAFSPGMILYAGSTLADNWAMILLWGIYPEILQRMARPEKRAWLFMGILCGLPVLAKYQMLPWLAGLGLTFLIIGVPWVLIAAGAAGSMAIIFLNGLLDWVTWGEPFHSLIQQVSRGYEVSQLYSSLPWWDYFPRITEDLGNSFLWCLLLALGWGIFRWRFMRSYLINKFAERVTPEAGAQFARSRRSLGEDERGAEGGRPRSSIYEMSSKESFSTVANKILILGMPCLIFVLVHMLIGHKENRFLLPVYPVFFIFLGILLEATFLAAGPTNFKKITLARVGCLILLPVFFFCSLKAVAQTQLPLTSVNIASLEDAIYKDHGLSSEGNSCILLFNYSWTWTHGELILGQKAEWVETDLKKVSDARLGQCLYAIVPEGNISEFEAKAGPHWKRFPAGNGNYFLYKNRG